jgi:glycosyltransferase involved in cell wall biosynthesis
MIDLKVLITTYHQAFLKKSGGEVELFETAMRLNELGVLVDVYGPKSRPLDAYDVVLHFSVHGGGLELLQTVKTVGKRIVLWPNLWIENPTRDTKELIESHLALADAIVVKSGAEREHIVSQFAVAQELLHVVPAGVDACYGNPADPHMFKTIYRVDDYILWLGTIEERKNQLLAVEALRHLEIPIVFVGTYRNKVYYDACLRAAPTHFKFLPPMVPKSEVLRSAVQCCRLFLEVPLEPPGLSALEAGLAGRPLVLSDSSWSREHFGEHVTYVDPTSKESIGQGVNKALSSENRGAALSEEIRRRHLAPQCLEPLLRILRGD